MKHKINIAVDGYASCGKSTLARDLASKLGYIFIDSGAMYRAVTYYFLTHQTDLTQQSQIEEALSHIKVSFQSHPTSNQLQTYLNSQNVEVQIRDKEVSEFVSQVSSLEAVRKFLVRQQQEIGKNKGVVMDGRDIGTVVFPDAELKLFVTADIEVRTQRRYSELKSKGIEISLDEVKENLQTRDLIDTTRAINPLRQAEDAIMLDTSKLTREEQLFEALKLLAQKLNTDIS
ncbi:MAG: (d)CMP kinase [Sphingobacteriales bacterium]|nr:MAG: (d)CMP kinase [Sphingobacteriales bacterium]